MRQELTKRLEHIELVFDAPMSRYTSFHIGGPATALALPRTAEDVAVCISAADGLGLPYYIIGNGSNILVSDKGLDALVIRLCGGDSLHRLANDGALFHAGAGVLLSELARFSVQRGYTGLEWAAGIPGTVGGAVAMNAGAYGGDIRSSLKKVTVLENGKMLDRIPLEDDMGYRRSIFCAPERVVLNTEFLLEKDDGSANERLVEYMAKRKAKQPLEYPSAGSTFKRPEGHFAGALIEQAGLKGTSVGGAQVSTLHAGFIINTGGATCSDVLELVSRVQQAVYENSGVRLEPEIRYLGQ